ncbi:hypothetical protein Syun_009900 [Stephania yunnanensis]|uniref:Uncharacterized protein n=1 Tax=Stephania yunnanensis TaxID=152371 RepID=A0AAP0KFE7_9MAGN
MASSQISDLHQQNHHEALDEEEDDESSPSSRRFPEIRPTTVPDPPTSSSARPIHSRSSSEMKRSKKGWRAWRMKRIRRLFVLISLLALFFLMNWWMISRLQDHRLGSHKVVRVLRRNSSSSSSSSRVQWSKFGKGKKHRSVIFSRMLALAAHALAEGEGKPEPKDLWEEPLTEASSWSPCADQRNWDPCEGKNGYILVSANGGINQQRVAVCLQCCHTCSLVERNSCHPKVPV